MTEKVDVAKNTESTFLTQMMPICQKRHLNLNKIVTTQQEKSNQSSVRDLTASYGRTSATTVANT